MKKHGKLTKVIAEHLSDELVKKGYDVLHDHGTKKANVGKIVSWFGPESERGRGTELSQLDIAIVEKSSDKAIVFIEIEETNDRPKTFLGDIFGFLLGEKITFREGRNLLVGKWTTLVILGKSKILHKERNDHILDNVERFRPTLSTANSKIGRVVIETVDDEDKLSALALSVLDRVFKRGF